MVRVNIEIEDELDAQAPAHVGRHEFVGTSASFEPY
jgi:hypothetical protein